MSDDETLGCSVCGKPRDRQEAMEMLRAHAARGNFRFKTYDMCSGCEDRMEEITSAVLEATETDEEQARRVSRTGKRLVDAFLDD